MIRNQSYKQIDVKETAIQGCYLIQPKIYEDSRGFFFESYNEDQLKQSLNIDCHFVQDNHSHSRKGVLRGLHFQKEPYAQAKLVRVSAGSVLDVVVDLRRNSPQYGKHYKTILSAENKSMLFITKGIAHGFLALEQDTVFTYKCDQYYHPEAEAGIIYNDPTLAINWEWPEDQLILSEKDRQLPLFKNLSL